MAANAKKKPGHRDPARFSARVQAPGGKIQELGVSVNLRKMITLAKTHHSQHGWNTWVWNVRTGETVFGIAHAQKSLENQEDTETRPFCTEWSVQKAGVQ